MRALILILLASSALAAGKPKVVVDSPSPVRGLIVDALKKKFTPIPLKNALSFDPEPDEVIKTVRETGAIAVVTARLNRGAWAVIIFNGANGLELDKFKFIAGKKPVKALPKGSDLKIQKALKKAKAPRKAEVQREEPPEPPKEERSEQPKEEPAKELPVVAKREEPKPSRKPEPVVEQEVARFESDESDLAKPVALRAGVGFRIFGRRFFYNDDLFNSLSKYKLDKGPALAIEADWFPGAHVTRGIGANIGLSLGLKYAFAINSIATDGTRYGTSAIQFRVGVMGRIPLGSIELAPQAGYVVQTYAIASGAIGAAKPNIPDVSYGSLRFGVGSRVKLVDPLFMTAGFAFNLPLSVGEIRSANYFPHLKALGLDANLGVGLSIGQRLELRLGVDYVRYWYSLNPDPADPGVALKRVAGGALDDSFGGALIVAFVL